MYAELLSLIQTKRGLWLCTV